MWPDGRIVFTFWTFTIMKIVIKHKNCAKVESTLNQIWNKTFKNWQRCLNLCQSGEITPNMVTLKMSSSDFTMLFTYWYSFVSFGIDLLLSAYEVASEVTLVFLSSRPVTVSERCLQHQPQWPIFWTFYDCNLQP